MKKHFLKFLLFISVLAAPIIGNSSWIDRTQGVITPEITVKKEDAVCISFDGGGRYYPSIESALEHANARAKSSMQILVVLPGVKTTIKESCKIGDNVHLYVPYDQYYDSAHSPISMDTYKIFRANHDEKKYSVVQNGQVVTKTATNGKTGPIDVNYEQAQAFNSTEITLAPNVRLTIEHGPHGGNLYLGGEYGESGVNGYHSAIYLSKGSSIYNGGLFKCCGYVKELCNENISDDQDTRMVINDNANLITPMSIYKFTYAGSTIDKLINNKVCPINIFDFPYIQTNNIVYGNANFSAPIHMYRNIAGDPYIVDKNLAITNSVKDSDALFKTPSDVNNSTDPFQIEFDYKNNKPISREERSLGFRFSDPNASQSVYTDIKIHKKINLGHLQFDLGGGYNINTSQYFLPISYRMKINLKSGSTFGVSNNIKLMPGTHLTIDQGAQLSIFAPFVAHKKSVLKFMDDISYPDFEDAYVENNGSVVTTDNGRIGGKFITADTTGRATLNLINARRNDRLFCETNEGKLNKKVITQLEGVTYYNNEQRPCFFEHGIAYPSIRGSALPGWVIQENNIPHKVTIKVNPSRNVKDVYAYNILKDRKLVGNFLTDTNYELYIAPFEDVKVEIKRTRTYTTSNITLDSNGCIKSNNDDGLITITPAPGKYLNIKESDYKNANTTEKITSFSGRGTVVTSVYEFMAGDAENTKYLLAQFGSSCKNLKIAYQQNIKIETEYGYWSYGQQTLEWGDYNTSNNTFTKRPGSSTQDFAGINWALNVEGDCQIVRYGGSGNVCFAKDTKVLMADNTYKLIQDVTINDQVMALNHETGKLEPTKLLAVVNHGLTENYLINLIFDNSSKLSFVGNHEVFDYTTMKYEEINSDNVNDYLGHEFASFINGKMIPTKLTNYNIYNYKNDSYTLVSYKNLNIIAEGMLTFTSDLHGLTNYFEYNDDLSFNKVAMDRDIALYGLYAYEDWKDKVPYFMFEGYNFKYFKVSIAKGLMTYEDVLDYIEYSNSLIENGEMVYPE